MSGTPFHPAVRGILEAALTEHQQAANLARLAGGPGAEDAIARLDDIAEGLRRVIGVITPDLYENTQVAALEKNGRAYALVGRLLSQLADYKPPTWENSHDHIVFNLHSAFGGSRAAFRDIAGRLGIDYISKPFGLVTGTNDHTTDHVSARGIIDGLEVEIYGLLPCERCIIHDLPLVDELCEQCENPGVDLTPEVVQDEDQPTPQPAAPVRGHGQNEEHVLTRARQLLENDDPDEDDELAEILDLDEYDATHLCLGHESLDGAHMGESVFCDGTCVATHSLKPGTSDSRCGDVGDVYSNRPTCPTCRSLLRAERRGATTPPTGDPS